MLVQFMRGNIAVTELLFKCLRFGSSEENLSELKKSNESAVTMSNQLYLRLCAFHASLLLLSGHYAEAEQTINKVIMVVNPVQDQFEWGTCLFHRSFQTAALGKFSDSIIDLVGASAAFDAVHDITMSLTASVMGAWYKFLSGDVSHEVDRFISEMDTRIATESLKGRPGVVT